MQHWYLGVLVYFAIHGLHIFVWRFFAPAKQFKALGALFLGLGPLALTWVLLPVLSTEWSATVTPYFIYCCLSVHYIAMYPSFQAISPTLEFLYRMKRAPGGMTEPELASALGGAAIVNARVDDLLKAGLIKRNQTGDLMIANFQARLIGGAFRTYRLVLGLPEGEG